MVHAGNGAEQDVRACLQIDRRLGTPSRADAVGPTHVPRPVRQTSSLGLPRRDEVIHVHLVGQFDKLDVMRLLSVIQQADNRLSRRQLLRPVESVVRRMERRDGRGSCDGRNEEVGGTACHQDRKREDEGKKAVTSSRHNDNR